MDTAWKLFGVGAVTAILCAAVRSYQKTYALGLAFAAVALLAAFAFHILEPVKRSMLALQREADMDPSVFSTLLRVCGIGLLTEISGAFCTEAGEQSIGRVLEFGGCAAALCTLLPLLDGVLESVRAYIGG